MMDGGGSGGGGAPHGALLALVVVAVVAGPMLIGGEGGVAAVLADSLADLLTPAGLLLLPVSLLVLIRFLSSDRVSSPLADFFSGASRDSIHRVGGSPVGIALFLVLLLLLLYYRVSIFGDEDDSGD